MRRRHSVKQIIERVALEAEQIVVLVLGVNKPSVDKQFVVGREFIYSIRVYTTSLAISSSRGALKRQEIRNR